MIDLGPKITLHSLYIGKGAITASFYAFEEDFFAGRDDEGLVDQLFSVQLDNRTPYELQVTAKPGADVAVRFDGVGVGPHSLRFGETHRGKNELLRDAVVGPQVCAAQSASCHEVANILRRIKSFKDCGVG